MHGEAARDKALKQTGRGRTSRVVVLGAMLACGLLLREYLYFFVFKLFADDAYIFLRYAQNAANGNGLVFNVGEPVMGFTSPLFVLILTGFARLGANLEIALILFNGMLFVALSLLLLKSSLSEHKLWWLFPLLWAFYLPFVDASVNGMETMLFMALQWSALILWLQHKRDLAIVCAALSALTRPEGVLFAIAMLVAIPLSEKKRFPGYGIAGGVALGAVWALYAQSTYGSILPQSMLAKSLTMQSFDRPDVGFLDTFMSLILGVSSDNVSLIPQYQRLALLGFSGSVGLLALYGTWNLFKQRSVFVVLPIFFVLALAFYVIGDPVRIWSWYAIPPAAAIWWVACHALGSLWGRLGSRAAWPAATAVATVAAVACMFSLWAGVRLRLVGLGRQTAKLEHVAKLINSQYPDAKSIVLGDIGLVGYRTDLRVIDLAGLVWPAAVEPGTLDPRIVSFAELVNREEPDAICLRGDPTTRKLIRDGLVPRATFSTGGKTFDEELAGFQRTYTKIANPEFAPYVVFVRTERIPS